VTPERQHEQLPAAAPHDGRSQHHDRRKEIVLMFLLQLLLNERHFWIGLLIVGFQYSPQAPGDAPLAFRTKVDDIWTANPFRLYHDLRQDPQRGREQADRLRKEVIGF
jgi:hypothetical protein